MNYIAFTKLNGATFCWDCYNKLSAPWDVAGRAYTAENAPECSCDSCGCDIIDADDNPDGCRTDRRTTVSACNEMIR